METRKSSEYVFQFQKCPFLLIRFMSRTTALQKSHSQCNNKRTNEQQEHDELFLVLIDMDTFFFRSPKIVNLNKRNYFLLTNSSKIEKLAK